MTASTHVDPDDGLNPFQRTRRAAHRAVDRVFDALPLAIEDANSRGFPSGRGYDGGGAGVSALVVDGERIPATTVEIIALQPSRAVAWLDQYRTTVVDLYAITGATPLSLDPRRIRASCHARLELVCHTWPADAEALIRAIVVLANQAANNWPPPLKVGDTAGGVIVGRRSNLVEACIQCGRPVSGGYGDPIRRVGVDSQPVHKSPCWFAWSTSRTLRRIGPNALALTI